jgi:hypothetical protein
LRNSALLHHHDHAPVFRNGGRDGGGAGVRERRQIWALGEKKRNKKIKRKGYKIRRLNI